MIARQYDRGYNDLLRRDSILTHIKVMDFVEFMKEANSLPEALQHELYYQVQELVLSFHEGDKLYSSQYRDMSEYDRMYCIFNLWLAYYGATEMDLNLYHKSLLMWRTHYALKGMTSLEKETILKEIKQNEK